MSIGFESPSAEGLLEVHKRFNLHEGRDLRASAGRIFADNYLEDWTYPEGRPWHSQARCRRCGPGILPSHID